MENILSIFLIFGLGGGELFVVLVLFVPYFIPSIIAYRKVNFSGILILNIFLGWTILGWIGALIWAVVDKTPAQLKHINNLRKTTSVTKNKCGWCGFESYEKTTFCPVCAKDEKGLTIEDYKNKYSNSQS